MQRILDVRQGNIEAVAPGLFPKDWPAGTVANFLDVVARDLAEVISPLPSVTCSPGSLTSEAAKKAAAKRTKIAHHHIQLSQLETELVWGVDRYLSYGIMPLVVEPDFKTKCPIIRLEDPRGVYYEIDRFRRCNTYVKVWSEPARDIAARFPEHKYSILRPETGPYMLGSEPTGDHMLDVVHYCDNEQYLLFLPQRRNLILSQSANPMGRVPVAIVERRGLSDRPYGQFDDVLWVQLARAKMALLGLAAVDKSVNAPVALPDDVQTFPVGPDAIIRSRNPRDIGRVKLDLPQEAFAI